MITLLIAAGALLSYLAGRLHGRARRMSFLATGFDIMNEQVTERGLAFSSIDDLTCSAADVSRAFGSGRLDHG